MQVFLHVRRGPYSFLVEGVEEAVNRQRFVVMGSEPFQLVCTDPDQDPMDALERHMLPHKLVQLPEFQPVAENTSTLMDPRYEPYVKIPLSGGGAFGYVSYDAVHHFEPRVRKSQEHQSDPLALPEAVWMLFNTLVAYDHHLKCVHIVGLCRLDGDVATDYALTVKRMAQIRRRLFEAAPQPSQMDFEKRAPAVSNVGEEGYKAMVNSLKKDINQGEIIQAVPSQRLARPTSVHPFEAYRVLRELNPSPYMYYVDMNSFQIVGASPECLVSVRDGVVTTFPIAGTRPRGSTDAEDKALEEELLADPKERAEHIMLVDLGRNDINRICKPSTARVEKLMGIERYSHVMHIVSRVSGTLRDDRTALDAFRSIFPAGTVSGAPKVRAIELVASLEKERRGVYAGAIGYASFDGHMDTCIALRTLVFKAGVAYMQAGGGIVFDSEPDPEYMETIHKMGALARTLDRSEALQDQLSERVRGQYSVMEGRSVDDSLAVLDERNQQWASHSEPATADHARWGALPSGVSARGAWEQLPERPIGGTVLLIDNYDSFTWNLYQLLSQEGAHVVVHRNDRITLEECQRLDPDRVVISPGPGHPRDAGISAAVIQYFAGRVPVLGVCLGHQAMVELYGGVVSVSSEIKHGKTSRLTHDGLGLFEGVPPLTSVIRYHSLCAEPDRVPDCLEVTCRSEFGHVMGVRHRELQLAGVQFHPESIKSDDGRRMLRNFLLQTGGVQTASALRDTHVRDCVVKLAQGAQLTASEVTCAVRQMMSGRAPPAQVAAFLAMQTVERARPETLRACAEAMLSLAEHCELPGAVGSNAEGGLPPLVDIVGTGGDGKDAFNVSTAAGIVVAATGKARVAKHGNRSSSGSTGSVDFLEALGAQVELDGAQVAELVGGCGFGFLFAQRFHPSLRHLAAARKQLGIRTIFNLVGPLCNPARPPCQVTGVPSEALGDLFATLFAERGDHPLTLVVHSSDGLDEVSVAAPTHVWEVRGKEVLRYQVEPERDFGVQAHPLEAVCGGTAAERAARFRAALAGDGTAAEQQALLDFVLVNAAVALYATGAVPNLRAGTELARAAVQDGRALQLVDRYVALSSKVSQPATILDEICARRRQDVEQARRALPLEQLRAAAAAAPPVVDLRARLRRCGRVAVLGEVKRASPSRGMIAPNVNAAEQALLYARAGAGAISVLTEPTWFKGSLKDMRAVRDQVERMGPHSRPAVLCKDFLLSEYQLYEARAHGADACLLIVAALEPEQLRTLYALCTQLGMHALVEVCDRDEMLRALELGAAIIGVNNRNLHTFRVDPHNAEQLVAWARREHPALAADVLFAALSGIRTREDVERFERAGCEAVLVGETLMRAADPARCVRDLAGAPRTTYVKVCGVRSVKAAAVAAEAGADMIGMVFAESRRQLTVPQAQRIASVVRTLRNTIQQASLRPLLEQLCAREQPVAADPRRWFADCARELEVALQQHRPLLVGVFADQPVEEVNRIAEAVGLDLVQLCGAEDAAVTAACVRPVLRAVHVACDDTAVSVTARLHVSAGHALLLDTSDQTLRGGTGRTFDWSIARDLQQNVPLLLAGGLTCHNVSEAVRHVQPFAVDVSSGVETDGVKDLEKIRTFVRLAKRRDRSTRPFDFAKPTDAVDDADTNVDAATAKQPEPSVAPPGSVTPFPNRFGQFGGRYAPETLVEALEELERAYWVAKSDPAFEAEWRHLSATYIGRETPTYFAKRLSEHVGGARIWLKREDLAHTGAHKINNGIAQCLLAKRLGKPRIIAETGAGQHGVATATACALLGLECTVYMGGDDCRRQALNVFRMRNLGATVIAVESGSRTLKDAINEAMRDWCQNVRTTHYLVGSAIGPHPFPTIVRDFQCVIGEESKAQMLAQAGKLPDACVACVGGGSNAIGLFHPYVHENTLLFGVEAEGSGISTGKHSATIGAGRPGILHGTRTYLISDEHGQILETHSISAGLDYCGVGPEHAHLHQTGRAAYVSVTDDEAMEGFQKLSQLEGIVPALESSHAVFYAMKLAKELRKDQDILVSLSGRGDKDMNTVCKVLGVDLSDLRSIEQAAIHKVNK